MFHTQAEWMADEGIDVFRAISGVPTLQRFSIVEVFTNTPTYEVKVAFVDEEGMQFWRKFLCMTLSKVVEIVLGNGVVTAIVSVNSSGASKNIVLGEPISAIYESADNLTRSTLFYKSTSGELISDEISDIRVGMHDDAKVVWRS